MGERVASDPGFRHLVEAARDMRVPLSVFLGAKSVTIHHFDVAGRWCRSETGPEWTEEDRIALLALMAYEADLCPGCRQPLSETTKRENEDRYQAGRAIICHRCVATEIAGKQYEDHDHPGALLIPVELKP